MNTEVTPGKRGIGTLKRLLAGLFGFVLTVIGTISAFYSWGPLRNLLAEYQDSPISTYLLFGVPMLVGGLLAIAGGIWLLSYAFRPSWSAQRTGHPR